MKYVNNNDRDREQTTVSRRACLEQNLSPALNDIGLPGTGVLRIGFPGGFATAKVDRLRRG
jgi:hypothetical protein